MRDWSLEPLFEKATGRFRLAALVQKRWQELNRERMIQGTPQQRKGDVLDRIFLEILDEQITLTLGDFPPLVVEAPKGAMLSTRRAAKDSDEDIVPRKRMK